jgi:K+-transporting ATPase ATPase A chain
MVALTVQNFVSAASGMAVLVAVIRGFSRNPVEGFREAKSETLRRGVSGGTQSPHQLGLGSFWADLVRGTLYILLPLSFVLALALVWQGVVQTFSPYVVTEHQTIAVGPAASQIAIKQLGTNGGGFFNANSAHPFENPTAISNFLECLAILLIPVALTSTFGKMVKDKLQDWADRAAMFVVILPLLRLCVSQEGAAAGSSRRG